MAYARAHTHIRTQYEEGKRGMREEQQRKQVQQRQKVVSIVVVEE